MLALGWPIRANGQFLRLVWRWRKLAGHGNSNVHKTLVTCSDPRRSSNLGASGTFVSQTSAWVPVTRKQRPAAGWCTFQGKLLITLRPRYFVRRVWLRLRQTRNPKCAAVLDCLFCSHRLRVDQSAPQRTMTGTRRACFRLMFWRGTGGVLEGQVGYFPNRMLQ